jgi:hypothetical protein
MDVRYGYICLEDEEALATLPENPTRKEILGLLTVEHFEEWMDSIMDGMCASWDKDSFVNAWHKDNACDHQKITIKAEGDDADGNQFEKSFN